jgi:hypothetical protein
MKILRFVLCYALCVPAFTLVGEANWGGHWLGWVAGFLVGLFFGVVLGGALPRKLASGLFGLPNPNDRE